MDRPQAKRLDPFPEGWFRVAGANELRPKTRFTRRVWGTDVLIRRPTTGRAAVLDPDLRCPPWPSIERHGQLFAFFSHDRRAPDWRLPDEDMHGFRPPTTRTLRLTGHVQDAAENGVDLAHFRAVHGYRNLRDPQTRVDGPHLWSRFAFDRAHPFLPFGEVTAIFDTDIWGLGFSRTDLRVPSLGLRYKLLLMATPVEARLFDFTVGVCLQSPPPWARARLPRPLRAALPWRLHDEAVVRMSLRAIVHDVSQDRDIWASRIHLERPALAADDGPIGELHKWARQFYPPTGGGASARARRADTGIA